MLSNSIDIVPAALYLEQHKETSCVHFTKHLTPITKALMSIIIRRPQGLCFIDKHHVYVELPATMPIYMHSYITSTCTFTCL